MAQSEYTGPGPGLAAARFARSTARPGECAHFYGEIVGLTRLFTFTEDDGYSGVVFGLPDASAQLELVSVAGAPPPPPPDPESAVVLYLREDAGRLRARLAVHGVAEVVPDNPYWTGLGAFAVTDPDGWILIVVPPPTGKRPDPGGIGIEEYFGERARIAWSLRLAEDSEQALASYIDRGRVWVARDESGAIVGHILADGSGDSWEILNTAVLQQFRGAGVGRRMIEQVARVAAEAGAIHLVVATGAADIGNLRFYQRCGFRMTGVVPDVFTTAAGYPESIEVDGIALRDQVWFRREL